MKIKPDSQHIGKKADIILVVNFNGNWYMQLPNEKWHLWADMAVEIGRYRELFQKKHNATAPPVLCIDFVVCDENADRAEEMARKYAAEYFLTAANHYEMAGDHFEGTSGYNSYAEASKMLNDVGVDTVAQAFVDYQIWGTPEQILEKAKARKQVIGDFKMSGCFSFAGMPYDYATKSMSLFAEKCIPELHNL